MTRTPVNAAPAAGIERWQDTTLTAAERAADLVSRMTLEEKAAQLVGVWVGADASGGAVAPLQQEFADGTIDWEHVTRNGLGQLTRPYGTAPVEPEAAAASLDASQEHIRNQSRFGIPALVHEECLSGFAAWQATAFPTPLAWGASFNPDLIADMAAHIGDSMRAAGVHQGLAPVLDVTRDYRWGRTEETISEDPVLVSQIGAAYVRGLESSGIISTLKHFAGYSASRAGRNLAPVSIGKREFTDVILPPFEVALRHGGARSVMHSYTEMDGIPSAADRALLTELLRDELGFDGTVVADSFGIRFLQRLHGIAADGAEAAHLALDAGVDVELPTIDTFGAPLIEAVTDGRIPGDLIDRAVLRVLTQKISIGLLDGGKGRVPHGGAGLTLNTPVGDSLAEKIARESLVLLSNPGQALPLSATARIALVGPLADDPLAMLGCYSFPAHVGGKHPDVPLGLEIPTVAAELRDRFANVTLSRGCDVDTDDTSGFAEAGEAARDADVVVVAVGDRAGLFGRGTSGEGCDAADLRLPGVQQDLIEELLASGTPVVVVLLTGRPYALGSIVDRAAAVVQGFFPGQCGGAAVAGLLAGEFSPSGRLPVGVPRDAGSQPGTYLSAPLGLKTGVSNIDPTPLYGFGHGLSYTSTEWSDIRVSSDTWATDSTVSVDLTVTNTGPVSGSDVVQLYLHDPVAQVTRPVQRLLAFAKTELAPGDSSHIRLTLHADLTSFAGRDGHRIVEPGAVELRLARSSTSLVETIPLTLTGPLRRVGTDRVLIPEVTVTAEHPSTPSTPSSASDAPASEPVPAGAHT
ncbi:MAG: glycoside hydrolase family 3 N-terminal domain-containing protein [Mycetocola sp.]